MKTKNIIKKKKERKKNIKTKEFRGIHFRAFIII